MAFHSNRLVSALNNFRAAPALQKAEWARTLLFWLFWLSIATFPLGQAFRETGPILCLAVLLPYHYWGYKQSSLRRFPLKWLFAVFYALICVKTATSLDPRQSFVYVLPNIWKGFALPFIAMECAHNARDLRRLIWAFAIVCGYEGLDGVYQHVTGYDLINHTAIMYGRLTGSLSTYRVGNYIALVLVPALGLWWVLRRAASTMPVWKRAAITAALLTPGLYLLVFAQARSGYLGFGAALFVLWFLLARPRWYWLLSPVVLLGLALHFGPHRISAEQAMRDGRLELWDMAWQVIQARPLAGWGMGMFGPAFKALGLHPEINSTNIQHPHSMYIQFAVDTGFVGLGIALLFLYGMLFWAGRHYVRSLPAGTGDRNAEMWTLGAFFLAGWVCYLVEALSAHDFLRTWWMAVSMGHLGVMIGATVNALNPPADAAHTTRSGDVAATPGSQH
ncbi:MAG TPA: O-antigen ligase family protein [Nitratidesulfovibrio sp.]|nr:O-antigen ligase family protein [Nitratidesulfovibrio sp.]